MTARSRPSATTALGGGPRLTMESATLMDRVAHLMRAIRGPSHGLAVVRSRAQQLQTENARLRREIGRLRDPAQARSHDFAGLGGAGPRS